jgi:hypothetical protein
MVTGRRRQRANGLRRIEHLGSRRLLIRFSQPDHAALIKEYDGQVKTPEDRRGDGTDNMFRKFLSP